MEGNPNLVSRDTYRRVKGMNREEMSRFLSDICREAIESSDFTKNLEDLREVIGSVSGIGEKRLDEIMNAIAEHFQMKEQG